MMQDYMTFTLQEFVKNATVPEKYRSLLETACRVLVGNTLEGEEYPWHPTRGIVPSLEKEFRGVWNWDSAFHALGVSRFDPMLAREQILLWVSLQLPTGELPDVLMEDGLLEDTYGKPPVMPWAAMIVDRRDHDSSFCSQCYTAFVKFEEHWRTSRGSSDDLFFYDSRAEDPERRNLETRWESGWDNSVRWDNGINNMYPVDLSCFMIMLYRALAYFAKRTGNQTDSTIWQERALAVSSAVNGKLWNPELGIWLDRDRFTGQFSHVLNPACFMPLFTGIASEEQASSCLSILMSPDLFFPGFPTVSYNSPEFDPKGYWRGRTWLNVCWFALIGFRRYGYTEETNSFRKKLLGWCAGSGIRENYNPLTGEGLGAANFGWSAAFLIEFILGWDNWGEYE